jgi:transcriptional repressor NrdR
MQKALEKRPVGVEEIEAAINQIKHSLQATGEREISGTCRRSKSHGSITQTRQSRLRAFCFCLSRLQGSRRIRAEINSLEPEKA